MFRTLFVAALALVAATIFEAHAQSKPTESAPKTKLEIFDAQSGAVIIKGYSSVGEISRTGRVVVDAREITNATTQRKEYGITIEVFGVGSPERSSMSFVDEEEIKSLLAGIDYISKANAQITHMQKFEAMYTTRGDFRITVFNEQSGKIDVAVSSRKIGGSTAFLKMEDLPLLREYITKAASVIQDAKH